MWPECGPKAARMRPEFKILRPEISPCKFPVARAQPGLKLQARNPTRTMKKVARPSPSSLHLMMGIRNPGGKPDLFCYPNLTRLQKMVNQIRGNPTFLLPRPDMNPTLAT